MPTKAKGRDEKSSDKAGAVEKPEHLDKAVSRKKLICPICEDHIVDGSQRSIRCDGECATWLHSGCAGLSKTAHAKLHGSDDPFLCPHCQLQTQAADLVSLRSSMSSLMERFEALSKKFTTLSSSLEAKSAAAVLTDSTKSSVAHSTTVSPNSILSSCASEGDSQVVVPPVRSSYECFSVSNHESSDRRYNIVVSRIAERPHGTSWVVHSLGLWYYLISAY